MYSLPSLLKYFYEKKTICDRVSDMFYIYALERLRPHLMNVTVRLVGTRYNIALKRSFFFVWWKIDWLLLLLLAFFHSSLLSEHFVHPHSLVFVYPFRVMKTLCYTMLVLLYRRFIHRENDIVFERGTENIDTGEVLVGNKLIMRTCVGTVRWSCSLAFLRLHTLWLGIFVDEN